jgi:hypothetical protein
MQRCSVVEKTRAASVLVDVELDVVVGLQKSATFVNVVVVRSGVDACCGSKKDVVASAATPGPIPTSARKIRIVATGAATRPAKLDAIDVPRRKSKLERECQVV